ncbi:hypothetical protein [Marinobacterium sp. LSUCC0821]|uniref:hypothetical protein n=1 Tax=Marinobacterium sp. LSUCC0821 TaxID=2668067 RepID=UPI001451D750|nr:hypothetical protein [Marinobacterium sp. LSUCC0821]QJD70993.1 hypothetical protein HH196_04475 [Marinobacterium sp. LSUCC0821]
MNTVLSLFSFTLLTVFLGILAFKVMEIDLILVCAAAVLMCGYDFIRSVRANEEH